MTLNRLYLKNFKRYREREFEFSYGLTGIIGKNGAGKSTIFEAIIFALYGETKQNKESIKYCKADVKEEVLVVLYFTIDDKEYKIERALKGRALTAKAELYQADELIASSVKGVNESIVKLLGMSKEAFVNTVFASQKELTALSQLKSDERKKIIRKLLGLERVDRVEKLIISKLRDLNREIKISKEHLLNKEEIALLNKQIVKKEEELKDISKQLKGVESDLTKSQKSLEDLDAKLEEIRRLKEDYKAKESVVAIAQTKLEQFYKEQEKLTKELAKRQESKAFFEANRGVFKEYEALKDKIAKLQKQKELQLKKEGLLKEQVQLRSQLKALQSEMKELQVALKENQEKLSNKEKYTKAYSEYKRWYESLESELKRAEAKRTKAQTIIESTKKQLEGIRRLGKEANCPTCTRPLLNEYESVVSDLTQTITTYTQEQLAQAHSEVQAIEKKLIEAKEKLLKLDRIVQKMDQVEVFIKTTQQQLLKREESYNAIKKQGLANKQELEQLASVVYDATAHRVLQKELEAKEPLYKKMIGLEQLISEIPNLLERIQELRRKIKEQELIVANTQRELQEHKYSKAIEEDLIKSFKNLQLEKEKIYSEQQKLVVLQAKINAAISSYIEKLEENRKKSIALEQRVLKRDDLEKLKTYLASFKSAINSKVTPRISQIASELFFEITNGRYQYIEVDEEFDFYIYDEGQRYPLARFSGGEVDLANLVLRIAISKTLNELSSHSSIGFLAFDEVFGSQDEERRYAIMQSFYKISQHYREIFLISHDREIKEMFERVIDLT